MLRFLLKTEPSDYSYDDLEKDGTTSWSGVSNPVALKNLRSARKGDLALIYHTGDERAIVGVAEIASAPYEDPKRPGKTPEGEPKFAVVDLKAAGRAKTVVTLAQLKADKRFADFALIRQGRLSVVAVPAELAAILKKMAGV